jgi:hypothetical protein
MMRPTRRRWLSRSILGIATSFSATLAPRAIARAQECPVRVTRTAPAGIAGAWIRSVGVKTDAPITLPFAGSWLASLRRTTETAVVQRQLLFAPGDLVDTARIGETLRRLRDQRIYADVAVAIRQCAGQDTVDLVVTTRDAWTLRPVARIVPPSTVSLGAEDRNVLGTGRSVTLSSDQTPNGRGGSLGVVDPFLFGANLTGVFRFSDIANNHILRASVRHHELSVLDEWRGEVAVGRQTFGDLRGEEHAIGAFYAVADVGHRIGSSTRSVTIPYAGVEVDSGAVISMQRGDTTPVFHSRRFVGVDVGLLHRAAVFDTIGWFIPNRGFLDIPVGVEHDALLAPGYDRGQHEVTARYDAWLGRIWIPTRGHVLVADAWTSGYLGNVRPNHIDRLSISEYNEAWHGFWGGRLMFEQLLELDPDQRSVTAANISADPTYSIVPRQFRGANRALFASAEREFAGIPYARASRIDFGAFAAGSLRWDARNTTTQSFGVGAVGLRLRVISTNGIVNSTRVDIAFPVQANTAIPRRPLLSVSLGPLFDLARQRDGRRRQQ